MYIDFLHYFVFVFYYICCIVGGAQVRRIAYLECNFKLHQESIKSYIIPVVQAGQVEPPLLVDMFALSDDHVGGGSQEAYGRGEGEGVHQPQLNGNVVGAALK